MEYDEQKFNSLLNFSENQLREAYSRMDMPMQAWTKGTEREVEFLLDVANLPTQANILDLGCGQGRHSLALAGRGYTTIGVDFSESNIYKARLSANELSLAQTSFICSDARDLNLGKRFDLVICLYDVIGSFRNDKDNIKILKTIKRHLKKDGTAVISVMNMELTDSIAKNKCSLRQNPKALFDLPPSDTMAVSGNVFNPDYFLINKDDGLIYRKEQFVSDDRLATEFVVVDKRYRMAELVDVVTTLGFKVKDKRYVQAGKFRYPLTGIDMKAKELLLVLSI